MSWKPREKERSPRNSQEERSSVSRRFLVERHIEKSLDMSRTQAGERVEVDTTGPIPWEEDMANRLARAGGQRNGL